MATDDEDVRDVEPGPAGVRPMDSPPEGDEDELHRRCETDRESMEPHETATCAGHELVERYQAEEDGGS
jgi:hypothetical protein